MIFCNKCGIDWDRCDCPNDYYDKVRARHKHSLIEKITSMLHRRYKRSNSIQSSIQTAYWFGFAVGIVVMMGVKCLLHIILP